MNEVSECWVCLTIWVICKFFRTVRAQRAPQHHPWVRNVGCPGEIDCVDVVEAQFLVWVDPVHIAATG